MIVQKTGRWRKSGNTQKNEASITELLVEMVDRSTVFFPQDINPKKHL